uniref:Uncharacterized protein n=1 Tax=Arundo donax TaxID=35708 RepID=A0A0A8YWZ2_ARUDO
MQRDQHIQKEKGKRQFLQFTSNRNSKVKICPMDTSQPKHPICIVD